MKFIVLLFLLKVSVCTQLVDSCSGVDFSPNHYDITLRLITDDKSPVAKQFTAPGSITIDGVSNVATEKLVLRVGQDVEIVPDSVILILGEQNSTFLTVKNVTQDSRRLIIQPYPEIKPNQKVTIYLEFMSKIDPTCDKWGDENGNICYTNGTTDKALFSSSEPSNMFPCFNSNPKCKATFNLKLIRPNELNNTIANAGLETSVPDPAHPGWTVDTMKTTTNMFTNNFAFVSSNYGYVEMSFGKNNKTFRFHAPSEDFNLDKSKLEHIAADCVSLLNGSEEYFNNSQSVPKFDAILTPNGVKHDPWGLNILPKDYTSSFFPMGTKFQYFDSFARTIPDQWTQNIFENTKNTEVRFVSQKIRVAVNKDDGNYHIGNTRKSFIQRTPSLDLSIGYLLMLETFVTPETVQKGVFNCLKAAQISKEMCYDALQNATVTDGHSLRNLTVKNIFEMWEHHEGYPLLRVGSISDSQFNISLEAVKTYGSSDKISSEGNWTVAVNFKQKHDNIILIDTQEKLLVNVSLHDWIKYGGRGYHRTFFDDNTTQWIQQQLESNFESFDTLTRAYLLQDYNSFAKQGLVSYTTTLNLMNYISNETQPLVYNEFASFMEELKKKFLFSPDYVLIKNYVSRKLGNLWETAAATGYPESELYPIACDFGESFCYPLAEKQIKHWHATGKLHHALTKNARVLQPMLCSMLASGGKQAYDLVLEMFKFASNPPIPEYSVILNALACVKNETLLHEFLNGTLTKEKINSLLKPLAGKELGRSFILPYLSANWVLLVGENETVTRFTKEFWNVWYVETIIGELSKHMTTTAQLNELESFIKAHEKSLSIFEGELNDHLARVKQNILWIGNQGKEILEWVKVQK